MCSPMRTHLFFNHFIVVIIAAIPITILSHSHSHSHSLSLVSSLKWRLQRFVQQVAVVPSSCSVSLPISLCCSPVPCLHLISIFSSFCLVRLHYLLGLTFALLSFNLFHLQIVLLLILPSAFFRDSSLTVIRTTSCVASGRRCRRRDPVGVVDQVLVREEGHLQAVGVLPGQVPRVPQHSQGLHLRQLPQDKFLFVFVNQLIIH